MFIWRRLKGWFWWPVEWAIADLRKQIDALRSEVGVLRAEVAILRGLPRQKEPHRKPYEFTTMKRQVREDY